jgi:ABC-type transport system substrate-binding protein
MRRSTVTTFLALIVALIAVSMASATKGSSSLALVVVGSTETAAAIAPTYGSTITFDVQTNVTAYPNVNVRCWQGSAFVYDGWGAFWAGAAAGQNFVLSSGYWTSGAADCIARLVSFDKQGREQTLATTTFHVNA